MVIVKGVGATGKDFCSYGYSIKGDGKDSPTMGAIPNKADMISTKKINANTYEAKFTKAGKQGREPTFKVSNGGKTLTIHAIGSPDQGLVENVQVFGQAVEAFRARFRLNDISEQGQRRRLAGLGIKGSQILLSVAN